MAAKKEAIVKGGEITIGPEWTTIKHRGKTLMIFPGKIVVQLRSNSGKMIDVKLKQLVDLWERNKAINQKD